MLRKASQPYARNDRPDSRANNVASQAPSVALVTIDTAISFGTTEDSRGSKVPTRAFEENDGRRSIDAFLRKGKALTRALRSHQLWLTITYLGLLVLMARGIAS